MTVKEGYSKRSFPPLPAIFKSKKYVKGDPSPKSYSCFYDIFLLISWRKSFVKAFLRFVKFSRSYEVTVFWIKRKWRHSREYRKHFTLVFFAYFWSYGERIFYKPLWCFWLFFMNLQSFASQRDVTHTNELKQYGKCGLHINFWNFWLMTFCFMVKKDCFKQKLFLWPQVPFNKHLLWKKDKKIIKFYTKLPGNIYNLTPVTKH